MLGIWSLESFKLLRGVQTHDHAITALEAHDGIAFARGKNGSDADDACGLNAETIMWSLNPQDRSTHVEQLGTLAQVVWKVKVACKEERPDYDRLRKDKVYVDISALT